MRTINMKLIQSIAATLINRYPAEVILPNCRQPLLSICRNQMQLWCLVDKQKVMSIEYANIAKMPKYLVEDIIGYRQHSNRAEYLVQWRNFSRQEATWEPLSNLPFLIADRNMRAKYQAQYRQKSANRITKKKTKRPQITQPYPQKIEITIKINQFAEKLNCKKPTQPIMEDYFDQKVEPNIQENIIKNDLFSSKTEPFQKVNEQTTIKIIQFEINAPCIDLPPFYREYEATHIKRALNKVQTGQLYFEVDMENKEGKLKRAFIEAEKVKLLWPEIVLEYYFNCIETNVEQEK